MSIQRVTITSDYELEGIIEKNDQGAGVVICHPHPLYGGDMHNNVVSAMAEGFAARGFTTLRFNFRGIGKSRGTYDEGEGEVRDVLAALETLKLQLTEGAYILLAGYSFGAWICAKAAPRSSGVQGLFLISYPFAFYDSEPVKAFSGTIYFVGGEYDDIGPAKDLIRVYQEMPVLDKHLKIIPTSHFYGGKEEEIVTYVKEHVHLYE